MKQQQSSYHFNQKIGGINTGQQPYPTGQQDQTLTSMQNQDPFSNIGDIFDVPEDVQRVFKQQNNGMNVNPGDTLSHLYSGDLQSNARTNFIKKVYLILTCQLSITVFMCFLSYYVPGFLSFQINNFWLFYVALGFSVIVEIIIMMCQAVLLLIFTITQSYMVSFASSTVIVEKGGTIVVTAACMTLFVILCLSLYAVFTPTDFSNKWGIIIALMAPFIMLGIFASVSWLPIIQILYCSLGCLVFGFYIVIDTQLIFGGERRIKLSHDDYVVGALLLYIDIIYLFIFILKCLSFKK